MSLEVNLGPFCLSHHPQMSLSSTAALTGEASAMSAKQERRQQKKQLYAGLTGAMNSPEVQPDVGRHSAQQAWKLHMASIHNRTAAATRDVVTSTSAEHTHNPSLPSIHRVSAPRRQPNVLWIVPDAQRIFQGCKFFFFPNNDRNPARRLRIAKAQEHGAIWQRQWTSDTTHVVLDKRIALSEFMKSLKLDMLPDTVAVVSDDYLVECLSCRALLDPGQSRFAVKQSIIPGANKTASPKLMRVAPASRSAGESPSTAVPRSSLRSDVVKDATSKAEVVDRNPLASGTSRFGSGDFHDALQQAKALCHVINIDEDDSRPSTSEGTERDLEQVDEVVQLGERDTATIRAGQYNHRSMTEHTAGTALGNPNQSTIVVLQQMADYYDQTGNTWRAQGYRKAIATMRRQTTKICTREQAVTLPNIGSRLADKIEEIVVTRRLRRLDKANGETSDGTLRTFMGVYGVGIVKATHWIEQGYKTLDEVLEDAELTDNQRIGIQHYEDFNARIPREEVERHGHVIRTALQHIDPLFNVIIGGSYRRGAQHSGDIDCIVTRPHTDGNYLRDVVLGRLVPQLQSDGFIVASLASTSQDDGSKWHGASCLPGSTTWRRLDLLLAPSKELGAALLYFTGDDIFCRSMRLLASKKGMRLNQRGLYRDVLRGPNRNRLTGGTLVESEDERKIFEALGVEWLPPEQRVF